MSKLTVFCYVFSLLKSTAPRPEDSSLVNQKRNANSCSSLSSSSPVWSQVHGIRLTSQFLLKDYEIAPWKDASILSERRSSGLYVLHVCLTPRSLKVSAAAGHAVHWPQPYSTWKLWTEIWSLFVILINIDPSCHSVMEWLASVRKKSKSDEHWLCVR